MLISKFDNTNIEKKIVEVEFRNEIKLPDEYRRFLCDYNGGFTPKTKFKKGRISSDVRGFYGIGEVKYTIDSFDLSEWIDLNVFPVACDSFGNYYLIGLSNDESGKVFFGEHEKNYELDYLCNSFSEFVSLCKSKVISDASRLSIEEREAKLIANGYGNNINDALREAWQNEIDKYANIVQEKVVIT